MVLPLFVSVVCVVEDGAGHLEESVNSLVKAMRETSRDFEVIVIDNASTDESLTILKRLTEDDGVPNVQVYALTQRIFKDAAAWYGIERALGDVYAVFDPIYDDIDVIAAMLERLQGGSDVVFGVNAEPPRASWRYRLARSTFEVLLSRLGGIDLSRDAPTFRVMNRRVVSFVAQQRDPAQSYRLLPSGAGFVKDYVSYASRPMARPPGGVGEGLDRGLQMLVSTTRLPLRLVSLLALTGAAASLIYSFYVVALSFLRDDLAQGWVSLSLLSSGMFFLISMVLMVLGEYVIQGSGGTPGRETAHVSQEFNSQVLATRQQLNVESVESSDKP